MSEEFIEALRAAGLTKSQAEKAAEATRQFDLASRCKTQGHELGISTNADRDPVMLSCGHCGRQWTAMEGVVEPVQPQPEPTEPVEPEPQPEPSPAPV